jgi:NhaA family Na+:H+ antiporter
MAQHDLQPSPLTWIGGDRRLARRVGRPVRNFLRVEAAGGILLLIATVSALVWANSPWSASYHEILETHITIEIGDLIHLDEPIEAWINDALMAIFFFVVGLEIKRELVVGYLRDTRAAALPAIAAIGGMIVPAGIYILFNSGAPEFDGWGIPMATDIAFAVGVVSLLGNRVPSAMKVFLLTLAIVDDIGAIAVIAFFYTDDFSSGWFLVAILAIIVVLLMRLAKIWWIPAYVVVGTFVWLAVFESGIHATIAGVVLGLITPARPLKPQTGEPHETVQMAMRGEASAPAVRRANFELKEQVSVVERLEDALHPFSSYMIIPIFALANAGVELSSDTLKDAATSPVTLGVTFGLVLGKIIGVSAASFIAVKSGIASLPRGATWTHVFGLSAMAGIGFTVSLFITGLAFSEEDFLLSDEARIGILAASAIAAVVGTLILLRAREVIEVEADDPIPT